MNYAIHRISLDVNNDAPSQLVLSAKRGDSAKLLIISLLADKHNYIINEGCYATLTGKKRDGAVFEHECAIDLKNNKIEYPFQPFTVSKSGVVDCEVNIFNTHGERLTTSRFTIIVYETIFTDAIEDAEDDITAVTQLRADLNELIQTTEKKLENGEFVGEKGDKGDKGEQGEKGDTGATGAKILSTELIGQDVSGGNVYKQTFDNGSTAEFTAPKGEKGDKGEQGEQGIQGIQGVQGEKGERGEQGIQGIQGVQGEAAVALTIGEVTTGDAAKVENVGTPTKPILNFTLPRGEKGEAGISAGPLYEHRITCQTESYIGPSGSTWTNVIIHITSDKPNEYSGSELRQYFKDRGYTATSLDDGSWRVNATYPVMIYNKDFLGVGSSSDIVAKDDRLYLYMSTQAINPWKEILTAFGYIIDFVTPLNANGVGGSSVEVDSELSTESENPVQNKVITEALNGVSEALETTTEALNGVESKAVEMQRDINDLYLLSNATVTGTEEVTQEYIEHQTADGLSGLIDGALTRVTKIEGNTVKNKNLFNTRTKTGGWKTTVQILSESSIEVTATVDDTSYAEYAVKVKIGQEYTFAVITNKTTSSGNYPRVILAREKVAQNPIKYVSAIKTNWGRTTFTADVETVYFLLYGEQVSSAKTIFECMLLEGNIATADLPPFTNYFDGLKNSYFKGVKSTNSDGTKTDESFMLDNAVELGLGVTIDIQNKKIIDNSKMLVLNGTENFVLNNWATNNEWGNVYQMPLSKAVSKELVSSDYEVSYWGANWKNYTNVITTNENLLLIKTDGVQSVDEFKAYLAQRYADGNPVTIRYVSTEAIETDISIPTDKYQAFAGGSEKQIQGDTDNSIYGANNTITQTYVVKRGGAEA